MGGVCFGGGGAKETGRLVEVEKGKWEGICVGEGGAMKVGEDLS